jgi:catechol-2,3-dioxygenase
MAITGLNHVVLYVRDAEATATFFSEVLDFTRVEAYRVFPGGVFMRAPGSTNDHDLALFTIGEEAHPSFAGRGSVGMYHVAWEVETLGDLEECGRRLNEAGALVGASDHGVTRSLYAHDPDGLEFEVVWVVPAALITEADFARTAPLRLAKDIERFGRDTVGGLGVSRPA